MPLETGSILKDRYRIEGQLGKGGMGTVYLAYDQTLDIQVAVKENLSPDPDSEAQFRREAKLLASLRHPNLPRVTDHFILDEVQYLVMDYIEGDDLQTLITRQQPEVAEVLRWSDEVCDALTFLHTRRPPVIHRDLKPGNLKLQPDGRVVLVDFGIAKAHTDKQTATGARGMTPGFSPPEQFGGSGTDPRSDQYALGATLYYLMTGKQPANSIDRMLNQDELTPPREINPEIPVHAEAAITHALALPKDERFSDVASFKSAMHGGADLPTVRAGGMPRALRIGAPMLVLAALGIAATLIVGGGSLLGGGQEIEPTEPIAAVLLDPSDTPSPVPSDTPAPLPTETIEPTPTSTETPVPTETPIPVVLGGSSKIAFVSDRAEEILQIWTMNPDGTDPRQLTFDPGEKTQPKWSPDGTRLLYVAPGGADDFGNQLGLDLWVINADGTGIAKVTSFKGDDTEPAWSPDGLQIAFTSNRANNTPQVFIKDTACLDTPEGCENVRAGNVSCHTDFCAAEFSPAWAPAGVDLPGWLPADFRLAVLESINNAPPEIFVRPPEVAVPVDFDRRDQMRSLENLSWSPDGTHFLFTWFYTRGVNEIYTARVEDRAATFTKLTSTNGNKEPIFSPDGQMIAFTSTRDGKPDVYLMTAGGGNQTNLTNSPATRDMHPDWRPPLDA
ncbi:MAG: protein kinase [Chloroflexi bacterium]|nr:protein kinase [Chloroflexota bacterium]